MATLPMNEFPQFETNSFSARETQVWKSPYLLAEINPFSERVLNATLYYMQHGFGGFDSVRN